MLETCVARPIHRAVALASGGQALLVGTRIGDATASEVWVFDDAAYRADDTTPAAAFAQLSGAASREFAEAVTFAGPRHGDGRPLILSRSDRFPYTMWLDALDLESGTTELLVASATSAGCQDIAYVENEFGNAGYLIVCGVNGYDGLYWTEVGGAFELRTDLGANSLGNTSRIVPRPQGDYALVIQNSSDRVHRFEAGQMNASSEAPWFRTRRLWAGAFDPDGRRALLTGKYQSVSGAEFGGVFEARDGAYSCPVPLSADCDIAEVSIPSFGGPPWNAPNNTLLADVAWRPGCDGGLIVGGMSSFSTDYGLFATFQLEGGRPCW